MTDLIVLATTAIVVSIVSFIVGWNWSVHRWYSRQINLANDNKRLKGAVDDLAVRMESDEMRAAIDLGKEAILNDLDDMIAIERETIASHKP